MGRICHDISLFSYNTFRMDVYAKKMASFSSSDDLSEILDDPESKDEASMILGGGSNVLFTSDYDGLILKNDVRGIEIVKESSEQVWIEVGAGENWHSFVLWCIRRGFAGIENLSLIPGNVGASPMQNIGAYGVEIKEVFENLTAFHLKDGEIHEFGIKDCDFGYRESVFKKSLKDQYAILNVKFRLNKTPEFRTEYGAIKNELENMGVQDLSIKAISDAVIKIRSSKLPDPSYLGNAGSFFKNPVVSLEQYEQLKKEFPKLVGYEVPGGEMKLAAGWLIDQAGWKGHRRSDHGVHERQALVLVNYGGAAGKDVYDLSEDILQDIKSKYNVDLEREVNII